MVKKACSTFEAFFADVSRKGMPRESANSYHYTTISMSRHVTKEKRATRTKGKSEATYLCDSVFHDLLVRHVALISNKQLVDTLGGVSVNFLEPLFHVVKRIHVGDIVDDANAVGATVVGRGDGSESLLAGSIPLNKRNEMSVINHCATPEPAVC